MIEDLPIYPFLEGFVLSGGAMKEAKNVVGSDIKSMRWYWFRSQLGYNLISFGFVIAYMFLGAASVILGR